jgi:hypothetical protein
MKESSTESRTRDKDQAEQEAACGQHRGGLLFFVRPPRNKLVAVIEKADNSMRCDQDLVDDALWMRAYIAC